MKDFKIKGPSENARQAKPLKKPYLISARMYRDFLNRVSPLI